MALTQTQPPLLSVDLGDLDQLPMFQRGWSEKAERLIGRRFEELVLAVLNYIENKVVPLIPTGGTRLLRQSYAGSELIGRGLNTVGVFGSNMPYAAFVEDGTGPAVQHGQFYPPWQALEQWVIRKLGVSKDESEAVAKRVAYAIWLKGTEPQPVVGTWYRANVDNIQQRLFKGIDLIYAEALTI